MKEFSALRIPIESFLILRETGNESTDKLIYFDPQGRRQEKLVKRRVVEEAIAKLDGHPRAISRSSGGLVSAQPYQLILHHFLHDSAGIGPEIRIKVRFRDFQHDEGSPVTSGECASLTKNVLPKEMHDLFSFRLDGTQRFIMDFGQGVIPVYVFASVTDPGRDSMALFVERETIDAIVKGRKGQKIPVQRYQVLKDVVRCAEENEVTDNSETDIAKAKENYIELKKAGLEIIPSSLKLGPPIEAPAGLNFNEAREFLRKSLHRWNREDGEEISIVENFTQEDGCVTSDVVMYMEPI